MLDSLRRTTLTKICYGVLRRLHSFARCYLPRYLHGVFMVFIPVRNIVWCTLVGSGKEALMPSQMKGREGSKGHSCAGSCSGHIRKGKQVELLRVRAHVLQGRDSGRRSLKSSLASSALRDYGPLGKGVATIRRVFGWQIISFLRGLRSRGMLLGPAQTLILVIQL